MPPKVSGTAMGMLLNNLFAFCSLANLANILVCIDIDKVLPKIRGPWMNASCLCFAFNGIDGLTFISLEFVLLLLFFVISTSK